MGNLLMESFFRIYIFADKFKAWIITTFIVISFSYGFHVYKNIYELSVKQSLSYTAGLYAVDIKTPKEIEYIMTEKKLAKLKEENKWKQIYGASFLAKLTVVLTVLLLYIRRILSWVYRFFVRFRGGHTIVVGLGRNSRFFINSMLEKKEHHHRIMAFEIDKNNEYLDIYKNKKVSIVVDEVEKMLESLNLEACQNIFISTGSDEKNIYYALKFLEKLKGENKIQKLLVHIEDRTLRNFYSDEGVLNNSGIDLNVFSFYKESARMLFQEHAIDGEFENVVESEDELSIYIVGDDDLSIAMVVEACKLAHFPNEKRLKINCIAKDTKALQEKIEYSFLEMENIANIKINYENLDSERKEFYKSDNTIWKDISSLKHVFYCYDDIMKNIRIATKVKETTFLRRREKGKNIKFHIATMNHKKIAREIDVSPQNNVFVFAQAEKICSYDNLVNNDIDDIAKAINYDYYKESDGNGYTEAQKEKIKNADDLWTYTLINDKKSSMGQAIHIRTKLNYLGLELKENKLLSRESLDEENTKKIHKALEVKNVSDLEYSEETNTKLNQLALSEHNRWVALLMIMDYQRSPDGIKDKAQKYHPLLKPLSDFTDKEKKAYMPYDVAAILQIAKYETKVGNAICVKSEKEGK